MTRSITIIHLSDLHLSSKDANNQSVILAALWNDLKTLRANGVTFDLAFFTGDLIAKGEYTPANVQLARDKFLAPLLETASLKSERLFLVPGNHDVNIDGRSPYLEPVFASLNSQDQVDKYLVDSQRFPLPTGLEGFNALVDSLKLAAPIVMNTFYRAAKTTINGVTIGICGINSAWRASGKSNDVDCGRLIIGRRQIDDLTNQIGDCELQLGLFHHPTNWLAPFDNGPVQRLLALHFDGVFYGHNHDGDGLTMAGTSGTYFASNAGCLYQHRDFANGYSVITFDADQHEWTVLAREYFENRQSFDKAIRFAPEGQKTFQVADKNTSALAKFPSQEFNSAVLETVDAHLISSVVSDIAPKSLRAMFVEPPLSYVSQRQMGADRKESDKPLYLSLRDALSSKSAIFFVGAKESGKTTLLHRICCQSGEINVIGFPPFAFLVDLSNYLDTRAKLLNAMVQFAGGAYARQQVTDLMLEGSVAVCFDNLDLENDGQRDLVLGFVKEFEKCRYFFSLRENLESSLTPRAIETLGLDAEIIYIHTFGRKETRDLTKRWFGELDESAGDKVDEILSVLGRLNIPRTPFLISAMLWIKESRIAFLPVNKAAILDAFIDGVLGKLSESKERGGLDSTIKRHFLAAFSEELANLNVRRITVAELDEFTVAYFKKRALNTSSGPFLVELKARGILTDVGGYCGFKLNCVRAFFLASRLRESSPLLEEALSREGLLKFSEEIDYFTGSTRDRTDVLVKSLDLLSTLHGEIALNIDLSYFDDVSLVDSPFNQDRRAILTEKILGSRVEGEKREALLDRLDSRNMQRPSPSPEETVTVHVTDPVRRYMGCLQVTSTILRNSELVDDPALKLRAYETVTTYWCELLIGVLITVDFMDDSKELEVLNSMLPVDNSNLATYFIKILIPVVIMSIVLESLGTAKLQLTMEEVIESPREAVAQLLSTFLYVDLNLPKRIEYLERLLHAYKGNRFMAELIFFKIATIYGFAKLSNKEEAEMKKLVARSVDVVLTAKSHVEKNSLKNRFLADIEKRRIQGSDKH